MKRFHVHVHVHDLPRNVDFYSRMFGAGPTRVEGDYAKWMLEDPPVNFAISTRGDGAPGVDHLGIQVDDQADLMALKTQARAADLSLIDEGQTSCCYANSDKHWIVDPQGLPWEHFQTLGSIPVFGGMAATDSASPASEASEPASACCAPKVAGKPVGIPVKSAGSSCC